MLPFRPSALCLAASCVIPETGSSESSASAPISLEETSVTACTQADDGKTLVTVQFVARRADGQPLGADEVAVDLWIDGAPIDPEALLDADAEELASSLDLWLVLDTSTSMVASASFAPMLEAARALVTDVDASFVDRPGTFTWSANWFAERLAEAIGPWTPDDLLGVPPPPPGTATKLFAAVEHAALSMDEALAEGVASGPRDRRVMVVFSDGRDNYSWWDNHTESGGGVTPSGAAYAELGWPPTDLDRAIAAIGTDAGRTVYVLGLGDGLEVTEGDLTALADAGHGWYRYEPQPERVDVLFDAVAQQFTTLQTVGALIPLPPGVYAFEARVSLPGGPPAAITADLQAGLLPTCAP